jgi:hypothetical protein
MDNHLFRVALYDTSIKDLKERKEKRIEFDSVKKASAKLGLTENIIKRLCKNKEKVFLKALNGTYAVRHI